MNGQYRIEYDAVCAGCGYNIRTLLFNAACPECGYPVMLTLCSAADRAKGPHGVIATPPPSAAFREVAARTRHTVDAVAFLWFAHRFACEVKRQPRNSPATFGESVEPNQLCLAIRHFAILEFAGEAGEVLSEWGLATSGGVGTLVKDMVLYKALRLTSGDSWSDFEVAGCPDPWPRRGDG